MTRASVRSVAALARTSGGENAGHSPRDKLLGNLNVGLVAIVLFLSTAYLAMVIPSCGAATGDIKGQVLGMPSTSEQPVRLAGATVFIAGSEIDCGRRSDNCVTRTDSTGQYRFDDVPAGDYGLSFIHDDPTFANGTALGSQGREVNVSSGNVETVSVVLLSRRRTIAAGSGRSGAARARQWWVRHGATAGL